jgi:hypothetical protein
MTTMVWMFASSWLAGCGGATNPGTPPVGTAPAADHDGYDAFDEAFDEAYDDGMDGEPEPVKAQAPIDPAAPAPPVEVWDDDEDVGVVDTGR